MAYGVVYNFIDRDVYQGQRNNGIHMARGRSANAKKRWNNLVVQHNTPEPLTVAELETADTGYDADPRATFQVSDYPDALPPVSQTLPLAHDTALDSDLIFRPD